MSTRMDTLRSLVDQDPGNARLRYMLAMETVNEGDLTAATAIFEEVTRQDPDYGAAYFHGGQTLEKLGKTDEARQVYRNGIDATTRSGDGHTRSELQGALDMIGG